MQNSELPAHTNNNPSRFQTTFHNTLEGYDYENTEQQLAPNYDNREVEEGEEYLHEVSLQHFMIFWYIKVFIKIHIGLEQLDSILSQ